MKKRIFSVLLACLLCAAMLLPVFAGSAPAAEKPFANSAFYTQGDYTLHYQTVPAKGAEIGKIFLIHGFLSSSVYWDALAEALSAEGYRCVMVDVPNFGYSTRETRDTTRVSREALLAGLMAHLAPGESWIVAGHSMGGGIALNLATQYAQQVSSLMLYAPASMADMGAMSGLLSAVAYPMGKLMNCLAPLIINAQALVRLFYLMASSDVCYTKTYDLTRITAPLLVENTGMGLMYMMLGATPTDLDAVAKLSIPILLLWGSKDLIVTQSMSQPLREALSQAQVHTLDAGHMFVEARAEQTAAITLAWLRAANHPPRRIP